MTNKNRLQQMSNLDIARALSGKSVREIVLWLKSPADAITERPERSFRIQDSIIQININKDALEKILREC